MKAPKRSWPAFFFFQKEKRLEIKKANPDMTQKDLVSKLGEIWRSLSESEKKPFVDQERKDKARYMKEKEEYSKVAKSLPVNKTKTKKGKAKSDKKGPKRAWPPFFFFQEQRREDLKKENPNLNHKEIVSKLGEEWRTLTDEQKKPYVEKSIADQKRYDKEKKEFQDSLPEETGEAEGKKKGKSIKEDVGKSKEKTTKLDQPQSKKPKAKPKSKPAPAPKKNVKRPEPPQRPAGDRHSKRIKRLEEENYKAKVKEYKEVKGLDEEEAKKLESLIKPDEEEASNEPVQQKPAKPAKQPKHPKPAKVDEGKDVEIEDDKVGDINRDSEEEGN